MKVYVAKQFRLIGNDTLKGYLLCNDIESVFLNKIVAKKYVKAKKKNKGTLLFLEEHEVKDMPL